MQSQTGHVPCCEMRQFDDVGEARAPQFLHERFEALALDLGDGSRDKHVRAAYERRQVGEQRTIIDR